MADGGPSDNYERTVPSYLFPSLLLLLLLLVVVVVAVAVAVVVVVVVVVFACLLSLLLQ